MTKTAMWGGHAVFHIGASAANSRPGVQTETTAELSVTSPSTEAAHPYRSSAAPRGSATEVAVVEIAAQGSEDADWSFDVRMIGHDEQA